MKHLAPGNRYSAPKDEEQEASAGNVRLSQSTKQGKDAILPGLAGKERKFTKFPVFSLSGKVNSQIPCAMATLARAMSHQH